MNFFKDLKFVKHTHTHTYNLVDPIGIVGREFAYGPGDRSTISGRVIPKTQKMVLDAALLSTQYYKV